MCALVQSCCASVKLTNQPCHGKHTFTCVLTHSQQQPYSTPAAWLAAHNASLLLLLATAPPEQIPKPLNP
jgi:hypothetical protein